MKQRSPLICSGDDEPVVTTEVPITTVSEPINCSCGPTIENRISGKFDIKCTGVDKNKRGETKEEWVFTCPRTGKSKTFASKCRKIAKKGRKLLKEWTKCK